MSATDGADEINRLKQWDAVGKKPQASHVYFRKESRIMNEQAKGSTMYERFSAVAELNKASGFDPLRFARRVVQDGCERLLLDLKYKKLWFRLRYPQGRIKITPLKITEQLAIIEAKVFFSGVSA